MSRFTPKETYRKILKKHYQDLTYEVKDETINGDQAKVEVEIEVSDFYKALKETDEFLKDNKKQFLDEFNKFDESKYIDYQLEKLKNVDKTVKYTLNLKLSKDENENWILDELDENQEQKILGIYKY